MYLLRENQDVIWIGAPAERELATAAFPSIQNRFGRLVAEHSGQSLYVFILDCLLIFG